MTMSSSATRSSSSSSPPAGPSSPRRAPPLPSLSPPPLRATPALGGPGRRPPLFALAIDLPELEQLLADQPVDASLVAEDRAQLSDPLLQVGELVLAPLALEAGEIGRAH